VNETPGIASGEPAGEHPGTLATAAYLDGTLPPGARDAVEAHLAACDACRAGVALLRSRDEGTTEEAPPGMIRRARDLSAAPSISSRAGSRRRLALLAGLAAGVLVVAGWALGSRQGAGPQAPVERRNEGPEIRALSPARGEAVEAARLEFRWSPVGKADRYVVSLIDAGGREVAALESASPGGVVAWPADRPLPPAGTYLWSVRAFLLDRVLAETRPVPFSIR
jgi:hypothetical protein